MGKWNKYQGYAGKYTLYGTEVVQLDHYMYQDYYSDKKGRRISINLDNIYDTKYEAEVVSNKMIAENNKAKKAYEEEIAANRNNTVRNGGYYLSGDIMSYSERRYYND